MIEALALICLFALSVLLSFLSVWLFPYPSSPLATAARRHGRSLFSVGILLVVLWLVGVVLIGGFVYLIVSGATYGDPGGLNAGTSYEETAGSSIARWLVLYNLALLGGLGGIGGAFFIVTHEAALDRMARAWNRFWFTPADPTLLGLIRICAGFLAVYTLAVYTSDLQNFFGENAWIPRQVRWDFVRDAPDQLGPLFPKEVQFQKPTTEQQRLYAEKYVKKWGSMPPPPYPKDEDEAAKWEGWHLVWYYTLKDTVGPDPRLGLLSDPRFFGLPMPKTDWQTDYVTRYIKEWGQLPPAPYPRDDVEAKRIDDYRTRWRIDPRLLFARGIPCASLWLDVYDPTWMLILHGVFLVIAFLFAIGFCTRLTSILSWVILLTYSHRNPMILFGADVMLNIVMLYLAIGPSGAALSVDRLLARWWAGARPHILGRWQAFWARWSSRPVAPVGPGTPPPLRPTPLVSANVAIRLLQIHVCIIYLAAGLAKLRGGAWWDGTAVWGTLANYEFAPMQYSWYMAALRGLSRNEFLLRIFVAFGTIFTLVFEITYAFLIWRRATRWVILGMAIMLHGVIGFIMGLKTFAFIMLVMNMAFLTTAEAYWLARPLRWLAGLPLAAPAPPPAEPPPERLPASLRADLEEVAAVGATHIKRNK
jgi:hypothetical protein